MKLIQYKDARFLELRETILETEELERIYGIKIPPIYKSFVSVFQNLKGESFIDFKDGKPKTLGHYVYLKDGESDIMLDGFMAIEDSLKFRNNADTWVENNVMPIGHHPHGGVLMIGFSEENLDKVFFEHEQGVEYLESNILVFISKIKFKLVSEVDLNEIIKGWSEEHWRKKENDIQQSIPVNRP